MSEKIEKLLEKLNTKLDAIILLGTIENPSKQDKFKILRNSVNIKTAARILEKDPSNFRKTIKKGRRKNG